MAEGSSFCRRRSHEEGSWWSAETRSRRSFPGVFQFTEISNEEVCKNCTLKIVNINFSDFPNMWLLPQKCVLAPKIGFFFRFFVWKNRMAMLKKDTDRVFLAFWPFENEPKFRKKGKIAEKNLKFGKQWIFPSQKPLCCAIVFFVYCLSFNFKYINNNWYVTY